ncbi:MAG: HlyD family efflux transporter periplasmic adaptor subunit [Patescibacteria group bacterium]|nr:HlyD family efflux transporter periplasmic adaptor subunit [Patescibacteria group bacterium]
MNQPLKTILIRIIIALIVVGGVAGGYLYYRQKQQQAAVVKYVLGQVEKGTLVVSVSGSGQVAASSQVDLKPKVSGEVLSVKVKEGDEVKSGAVIATIDDSDARKTVRDAQTSLQSAELSLEKLRKAADPSSITQAENALTQANENKQKAQDDLAKAYDDGYTAVADAFIQLPKVVSGLDGILHNNDIDPSSDNIDYYTDGAYRYDTAAHDYRDITNAAYLKAKASFDAAFEKYQGTTRAADTATIEALVTQTYDAAQDISDALKAAHNLITFYQDTLSGRLLRVSPYATTHLNSLESYTSQVDSQLTTLLNQMSSFRDAKTAITASDRSIQEKTNALNDLKAGADQLDIQSQELSVQQKRFALADAQAKLADYVVRAPFDGVVAVLSVTKGDDVSSGTAMATLLAHGSMVEVPFNEVDIAAIKVGQKATLSLDAYPDLALTGSVSEVETIGTVTQGVVNYTVKIAINSEEEGVKPGMSVTAAVITDVQSDVLLVPNAAIKTKNGVSTVAFVSSISADDSRIGDTQGVELAVPPIFQEVTIGSADDTNTVIKSGLSEGQVIVVRTISSAATSSTSSTSKSNGNSGFGIMGGITGGGGPPSR